MSSRERGERRSTALGPSPLRGEVGAAEPRRVATSCWEPGQNEQHAQPRLHVGFSSRLGRHYARWRFAMPRRRGFAVIHDLRSYRRVRRLCRAAPTSTTASTTLKRTHRSAKVLAAERRITRKRSRQPRLAGLISPPGAAVPRRPPRQAGREPASTHPARLAPAPRPPASPRLGPRTTQPVKGSPRLRRFRFPPTVESEIDGGAQPVDI